MHPVQTAIASYGRITIINVLFTNVAQPDSTFFHCFFIIFYLLKSICSKNILYYRQLNFR
jgi:hypothetical protein